MWKVLLHSEWRLSLDLVWFQNSKFTRHDWNRLGMQRWRRTYFLWLVLVTEDRREVPPSTVSWSFMRRFESFAFAVGADPLWGCELRDFAIASNSSLETPIAPEFGSRSPRASPPSLSLPYVACSEAGEATVIRVFQDDKRQYNTAALLTLSWSDFKETNATAGT